MLCQAIPYQPGFGPKQLAWMLHASVLGAVVAPLTFLGGPLLLRAAVYTAGMVAGMKYDQNFLVYSLEYFHAPFKVSQLWPCVHPARSS